jgi:hypothetical protein
MTTKADPNSPDITATPEGIIVSVLVQPRASRTQLAGILDGAIKVRLTSPPVDGAANALCIEFFAKLLRISKSRIEISGGLTSRRKTLRMNGISPADLLAALDLSSSTEKEKRPCP